MTPAPTAHRLHFGALRSVAVFAALALLGGDLLLVPPLPAAAAVTSVDQGPGEGDAAPPVAGDVEDAGPPGVPVVHGSHVDGPSAQRTLAVTFDAGDGSLPVLWSVVLDRDPGTDPEPANGQPEAWFTADVEPGTWWLHVRAGDAADRWGETAHVEIAVVDGTPSVSWPAHGWAWEQSRVDVVCPAGSADLRLAVIDADATETHVEPVHEDAEGCGVIWDVAAEADGARVWPDGTYDLVLVDPHGAEASERVPAVVAVASTVLERMLADLRVGLLTLEEVADLVLVLISDPQALPPRYLSGAENGGATTGDLLAVLELLDPDVREAVYAALDYGHVEAGEDDLGPGRSGGSPANCARSLDPAFFPEKCTLVYADFTITYSAAAVGGNGASGIPERVATVRDALAYARVAFGQMGFRLPDSSTSVYLVNPSVMMSGSGFSLPMRLITMDATHESEFYLPIHEYFHQVQYAYLSPLSDMTTIYWWMEATAEWASSRAQDLAIFPRTASGRYAGNLAHFLEYDGPLDMGPSLMPGGREYGAFVLAQYLHERHGSQTSQFGDAIHQVWQTIGASATGVSPLEAIKQVLASRGSSYPSAIAEFRTWTYALHQQHGTGFSHPDARPGGHWRRRLGTAGATYRRVTARADVSQHAAASGSVRTAPSNAAYVELTLPAERGLIRVQAQPSPNAVDPETLRYAAIPVDNYPTLCAGAEALVRTNVGAEPGIDVLIDPPAGCRNLTLVITNTRTSGTSLDVQWSASWEPRNLFSVSVDVAPGKVGAPLVENVARPHVVGGQAYLVHESNLARFDLGSRDLTVIARRVTSTSTSASCSDSLTSPTTRTPRLMVDDGTFLYFVDTCSSKTVLRRASLTTGAISTLTTLDGANGLTVDPGGTLYLTNALGLHSVDSITGITTTVESWTTGAITELTADATYLWLEFYRDGRYRIARFDPATGRTTEPPLPEKNYNFTYLTSAGKYLYAAAGNQVIQITKSTGATTVVAGSGGNGQAEGTGAEAWFYGINGIRSDGTRLLVTDAAGMRPITKAAAHKTTQPPTFSVSVDVSPGNVGAPLVENVARPHVIGNQAYVSHDSGLARLDLGSRDLTVVGKKTTSTSCYDSTTGATVRSPHLMVDDGTFLYFADSCSSKTVLRRASLTTGAISTLTTLSSAASGLTVGPGGTLYLTNALGLHSVDSITGITTTLESWNTSTGTISALTADGTHLWLTVYRDSRYRIARFDPATGRTTELPLPEKNYNFTYLTSAGNYLYAAAGNQVIQITKSTGATTVVAGSGGNGQAEGTGAEAWFYGINGIRSDGTRLLVTDAAGMRPITRAR